MHVMTQMIAKISLSSTDQSVIAGLVVTAYVMIRLLILQKKQKDKGELPPPTLKA
ncbi:MAG: hypothetical protein J6S47_06960 [Eubacteriaceae bacterium]|nr:hypothetical protein [Eubacteriaceae bacterium]